MQFLSFKELKPLFGIPWHRVTIYRKENESPPRFPRRTYMGPSTVVWPEPVMAGYTEALAAGASEIEATERAELLRPSLSDGAA